MTTYTEALADVPATMARFYTSLQMLRFVIMTPPTPSEWEAASPGTGYQVRISHAARPTTIRHRAKPPAPPEPIHAIDAQIRYDHTFPWSELSHTQHCSEAEFADFLDRAARTIGTEMTFRSAQS